MSLENDVNRLAALFGDPVDTITDDDAIEQGLLRHLFPEKWPWLLITDTAYRACVAQGQRDGRGWYEVVIPLMIDSILAVRRLRAHKRSRDVGRVELEFTAIGTVILRPNSKGGITIMLPEEE